MTSPTTAELIAQYANKFNDTYAATQPITSPLGVWLLLAFFGPATTGADAAALQEVLGTDVQDARKRAEELLANPHPAVAAAVAAWSSENVLDTWRSFAKTLPSTVTQGTIPSQQQANQWAAGNTYGLIKEFPLTLDPATLLTLASTLATDITWRKPLDVVTSSELGGEFAQLVTTALYAPTGWLFNTRAAGVVAATAPASDSGLEVLSVLADPEVSPARVLQAAHEVAALRSGLPSAAAPVDLFELELGSTALFDLEETTEERPGGGNVSRAQCFLPAWDVKTKFDVLGAPGVAPVVSGLAAMLNPNDLPELEAVQTAVASYTSKGFKAAAVTGLAFRAGNAMAQNQLARVRTLTLRFNRPHAVVASAGWVRDTTAWRGVPAFNAWVTHINEAQ